MIRRWVCICLCLFWVPVLPVAAQSDVSAAGYVVIDALTGAVMAEKEADTQRSMASTTKIMTTLLLLEQGNLSQEITVTEEMVAVEGSSMGLLAGDRVTRLDLCYGMMLCSGNDAANAAAIIHSGSVSDFADVMNRKARSLGMKNTHFVTPSGLDDDRHFSTPYDMALLTRYALQNQTFCQITGSYTTSLCYGNPPYKRQVTNHNKLLKTYEGCIGGKTGFTKKSGRCLVSAAQREGATLICVTLKAPDDWNDHKILLDNAFSQMERVTFSAGEQPVGVVGGTADTAVGVYDAMELTVPKAAKKDLTLQLQMRSFFYAPLTKGRVLGQGVVMYKGEILQSTPIVLQQEITKQPLSFWQKWLAGWKRLLVM